MNLAELEERYPGIPWREPLTATILPGSDKARWEGFACRVCIAGKGLRAAEVADGATDAAFETREEFDRHMTEHIDGILR